MEWTEPAIVLGIKAHGETSVILEVMTRDHGRHLGLVRGGRSRTKAATLQPGNRVSVRWFARLEQHLGQFQVDALEMRAGQLMETASSLFAMMALAGLLRLLPERDAHEDLYDALELVLTTLADPTTPSGGEERDLIAGALVVRYELAVLEALGFGLDLSSCAATGSIQDLIYVSPKSARAVCRTAGEPYRQRLLPLPAFLKGVTAATPGVDDVLAAFQLTGFFLQRNVYGPCKLEPDPASDSLRRALERVAVTCSRDDSSSN